MTWSRTPLTESEIRDKIEDIQNFAEIGDFFDQPVSTYSSGMVLRLAFAVLVQVNPEILIIDEALAVGDARFQLKCFAFLEEFKSKGGLFRWKRGSAWHYSTSL